MKRARTKPSRRAARPAAAISATNSTARPGMLHREMRDMLEPRADPAYLDFIATVIGKRDKVIGVRVPAIRETVRQFHAAHRLATISDAVGMLDVCAKRGVREELLFGTFWLARFRRTFGAELWPHISDWIDAIDNWETCDQLAMNIAAALVGANIGLVDDLVEWSRSANAWRRRFALATAASINQRGRCFPRETLRVCESVVNDAEPTIRKAAAWAIREASQQDAGAAFSFLWKHRLRAHPTVLREASEKLKNVHRAQLLEVLAERAARKTKPARARL